MKFFGSLLSLIVLCLNKNIVSSFTVTEGRTDNGKDIYNPARTGVGGKTKIPKLKSGSHCSQFLAPPINLECRLDFNVREQWTTCQWRKSFPEVPVDWVEIFFLFVMISI